MWNLSLAHCLLLKQTPYVWRSAFSAMEEAFRMVLGHSLLILIQFWHFLISWTLLDNFPYYGPVAMWWQPPYLQLLLVLSAGYQQQVVFSTVVCCIFIVIIIGGDRGIRGDPLESRTTLLGPLTLLLGGYNLVARETKNAQNLMKRKENVFLHFWPCC